MKEDELVNKNVSEALFKPKMNTPETSSIIGYHQESSIQLEKASQSSWYRHLARPQWAWQGLNPIDIESVLSRIASAQNQTHHQGWLDTIAGFRPGNWTYEWTQQGMQYQKKAQLIDSDPQSGHSKVDLDDKINLKPSNPKKARQLFEASLCFSLASYPHLKGDSLALQAQLLANKAYEQAMDESGYILKKLDVPYEGKKIAANLHLPHTERPLPVVIVCAGIDSLQTDLWRLFIDCFAKQDIAMLTLDLPGVGKSIHWQLTEDSSRLHQAVLNYLPEVAWIDHFNVHFVGLRFGGNVLTRLSFLEPNKVKSCAALGAPVHQWLNQSEHIANMPKMHLDTLASRIGKKVVDIPTFSRLLTAWSLKSQGILSGRATSVPILAMALKGDPVGSQQDNQSIAMFSQGGKAVDIKPKTLHQGYEQALKNLMEWLNSHIKG